MNVVRTKLVFFIIVLLFSTMLYSKTQNSTQPHETNVNAIESISIAGKKVVYSGSDDGFIVRWNESGIGEHFQVSDESIQLIAIHPNGNEIAVYESDGFSLNRLSVWNWNTQTKKFSSKRFDTAVTSLQYSAKGSYIMVGQANVKGVLFLDSMTGKVLSEKIIDSLGSVRLAQTSNSEESSVMYSVPGQLVYTDLKNGSRKASFSVEGNLESPVIFNNDVLFAGVKDSRIYIFASTSGQKLAQIYSKSPTIVTTRFDKNLYYVESDYKSASLKMIEVNNGIINENPIILKTFTFENRDIINTASKIDNTIFFGMKSGEVYSISTAPSSSIVAANKISHKVYDTIYDIAERDGMFYFLTEKEIIISSYLNNSITHFAENNGYTNIEIEKDVLYLWSKFSRKSVKSISIADNTESILFTPSSSIENLRIQNNKIVYVEGSNKVSLFDLDLQQNTIAYSGTGIQDALLYNNSLYVVKAAAIGPKSSLIEIDISTKETIPIEIQGEISFSLTESLSENGPFYGASIVNENDKTYTKIFSYSPSTKEYSILLSLADEDLEAFTYLNEGVLYTNIGKTQVYAIALNQRTLSKMQQGTSLPKKIVVNTKNGLLLNRDGSVSWFDLQSKRIQKNWYYTVDELWFEF